MPVSLAPLMEKAAFLGGRLAVTPLQHLLAKGTEARKGREELGKAVLDRAPKGLVDVVEGMSPGFDMLKGRVQVGDLDPNALAHELGHAEIAKSRLGRIVQNPVTLGASNLAPGVASVGGGVSGYKDEMSGGDHKKRDLAIGALAHAPQLGYEAGASIKGHGILRRAGGTAADLKRYRGAMGHAFGTYGLMPGASLINYSLGRAAGRALARHEKKKAQPKK